VCVGYKTYIGFLHLNHYFNNSVVNLFCTLLYNSVRPVINIETKTLTIRDSNSGNHHTILYTVTGSHLELHKIAYQCYQIQRNQGQLLIWDRCIVYFVPKGDSHVVKSQLSFNRWFVAYTLMKNPELQELRGHAIAAANQTNTNDENNQQSDICCESDKDGKIDTENGKIKLAVFKQSV